VVITDQSGCAASTNLTITQPTPLMISNIAITQPLCYNDCDGTAQVVAVGGTPVYSYQWTGGSPFGGLNPTAALNTGLCNGTFDVIVTDANGCTVIGHAVITNPPFISLTASSVAATCSGMTNGSATVNASGGTPIPGYLYQWGANAGNQTTATASNLAPGTYWVTVTDANGCTESISVTVTTPNPMYFSSVISNDLTCYMSCDGNISVNVTGGTPNYTYTWTNWSGSYNASTQNVSNLCQDTYYLTVTDNNNCTIDTTIIIDQPPQLVLTLYPDSENCYQACDGSINAVISGGTPTSYSFQWSNMQTTQLASNLCPGAYWVTVTDGNGCTITDNEIVYGPPELEILITNVTDATCGLANGSATISHIGGTTGYTILWSNGCNSFLNPNLLAGNYTVTVIDDHGCVTDTLISISNLGGPQITSVVGTNVTCNGYANGSATVNYNPSSPPAPPYTINWSNGTSNQINTSLSGGTYFVTVTDNNGCSSAGSVVIYEPPQLISAIISITNASCYGVCDGSSTVQAGGGTPPYNITWSNGQTTATASGLCAGTSVVTITDANSCQTLSSANISQPTDFTVSASVTDATCNGNCDGVISVSVSGATPIYSYNWMAPASGTNSVVAALCGNISYVVVITDAHGCDTILSYTVDEPLPIDIYTSSTPTTCGALNGTAQIDSVTGGTGLWPTDWTINWSPGNYTTVTITDVNNGNYALQVEDVNGCDAYATVNVSDIPPPESINVISQDVSCPGFADGQAMVTAMGGTLPYTYEWSNFQTSQIANNLIAGVYYVTVTDADGCTISGMTVVGEPNPVVIYADGPAEPLCMGQFAVITAAANGGTPPYTFDWTGPGVMDSLQSQLVYPDSTTLYQVSAVDANGCLSGQASILVSVYPPITVVASPDAIICSGDNTTLYAVASGGNGGPYTYSWLGAGMGSNITVSPLDTMMYIVQAMDNCGSPTDMDTVMVFVMEAPVLIEMPGS
ncbi:MAG: SprB repeat-containing protein, partial [Bacteroidota bacterium]